MFNRRKKNLLWILALVAVVIGVGTAFTAANTFDAKAGQELGYGTQTVSGANVTSMHYTLAADGRTVTTVTFIADGDLTQGSPVEVGYVGFTYGPGTVGPNATCGAGSYDGVADATTFVCDVTGLIAAERTVASISSTNIAVAN
jgi:hypothetical protein